MVGPNGNQTAPQLALVDTGCDYSTFPEAWAAQMGIDFKKDCVPIKGRTAGGPTKKQRRYEPGITALCLGHKLKLWAIFNPDLSIALLGREDFMSYFKASFDQRSKTFRLDPY